ncbi:Cholesterol dehydrogenase [Pannonibacter phragmitetus]|uniref:Cholesterol dehydrogenase n=1 Tax=Pannonibacter phragmitetus TaxID=121719 RepID=A0A379A0X1_9HYPH|nr:NAD-dependent epimerase/dehydratase family protein [Pannonibacter phragmitetus]SUB02730.1 Cholesterol dehydrogenase [Pannonibacter phragmitetus]
MTEAPLVALTGATGFAGQYLASDLIRRGYRLRLLLRRPVEDAASADQEFIGDLARPRNLDQAMRDVDFVVHSAGIAHAMSGRPEDDYRAVNRDATAALAQAARKAGVKRFVFLSSIRAQSGPAADHVLTEADAAQPTDAYGRSKLEAEVAIAGTGIAYAALRPVLVHGPGARGNLEALFALARKPVPLPFGLFTGKRSLISLANLAGAVDCVMRLPEAPNRPLIVADPEPVTLAGIIAAYRRGLGRRPGLLPVPPALLELGLKLAGKGEMAERLGGSLAASPAALMALGWMPSETTLEALEALGAQDRRIAEVGKTVS